MTTPHDVSRTDGPSPSAGWEAVYDRLNVPTAAHGDTSLEIVTDGGAPRTRTVARRLGVDPDHLHQFVERHPHPDVSAVDAAFGVDTADEQLVARWLDAPPTRGETA